MNSARPTLLLVDDDAFVRSVLRDALSPKYHVLEASDGREAMRTLVLERPNLMLLDLFMPNQSGMETLIQLSGRHPPIPVLVITGSASEHSKKEAMRLGAVGFLQKPLEPETVVTAVTQALARET